MRSNYSDDDTIRLTHALGTYLGNPSAYTRSPTRLGLKASSPRRQLRLSACGVQILSHFCFFFWLAQITQSQYEGVFSVVTMVDFSILASHSPFFSFLPSSCIFSHLVYPRCSPGTVDVRSWLRSCNLPKHPLPKSHIRMFVSSGNT